jgi:exonuclease III
LRTFISGEIIQAKNPKETSELNYTINQMVLTDIYRIFHPITAEYTFFS